MLSFKAVLTLFRISNLPTVWSNVLLFFFITLAMHNNNIARFSEYAILLFLLLFFSSIAYVLGMVWNDIFDFQWDQKNKNNRPLVQGVINLKLTQIIATFLLVFFLSSCFIFLNFSYVLLSLSLLVNILLYNLLHKKKNLGVLSPLFMASSRVHLYLLSIAIFQKNNFLSFIAKETLVSVALLFSYIQILTLFAKQEYRYLQDKKATKKKSQIVFFLLLGLPLFLLIDLLMTFINSNQSLGYFLLPKQIVYFLLTLGFYFIWIFLQKRKARQGKIGLAVGHLIAAIPILDSLLFFYFIPSTSYSWLWGGILFLMFPLTLWGQRYVSGT